MIAVQDFAIAMAVGLAWFVVLLAVFRPGRERLVLLLRIFVLGMVVCAPAGDFNSYWMDALQLRLASVERVGVATVHTGLSIFAQALLWILVAPVEEILKYCIVRACTQRRPLLLSPREGCLLAACSALGFATYENYHYMQQFGRDVIVLRGWLCPPGHMLWSAIWGYYLALVWMRGYPETPTMIEGLAIAALAHGTYNFLSGLLPGLVGLSVPALVVIVLGRIIARRLWTEQHVPFAVVAAAPPPPAPPRPADAPLGTITDAAGLARVHEILERMDHLDEKERIAALMQAPEIKDQRLYEKARALTHDPVASVRAAAQSALPRFKRSR